MRVVVLREWELERCLRGSEDLSSEVTEVAPTADAAWPRDTAPPNAGRGEVAGGPFPPIGDLEG
jgi:hypothetical protein